MSHIMKKSNDFIHIFYWGFTFGFTTKVGPIQWKQVANQLKVWHSSNTHQGECKMCVNVMKEPKIFKCIPFWKLGLLLKKRCPRTLKQSLGIKYLFKSIFFISLKRFDVMAWNAKIDFMRISYGRLKNFKKWKFDFDSLKTWFAKPCECFRDVAW